MKKWAVVLLALVVSALMSVAQAQQPSGSIRVMSYNIRRLGVEDNWRDLWWMRRGQMAKLILRQNPDLIGMQEVYTTQGNDLARMLPGYVWFGPPRDDGKKKGERNPIFYKKDRFDLLKNDTFWLSETPEILGSRGWDADCCRIVTWGEFRDKQTGKTFFYFNTHFDNAGRKAREMSAKLLLSRMKAIAGDSPAFVTGDFNSEDSSPAYKIITSTLIDSRSICEGAVKGPYFTSWTFKPNVPADCRIDYIFVQPGIRALEYATLDDTYGKGRRPSDHMAVMAVISIP